jgi:predicted small metal-binding protein
METDSKKYRELSCKDFRSDCDFTARAESEQEVLEMCQAHACSAHNKCSNSPSSQDRIRSRIRDVWT